MPELFSEVERARRGHVVGLWCRRAVLTGFALIALAGLLDVIGQRTSSSVAASTSARMTLSAPKTVRGGLFFQSRIEIRALASIEHPRLVLDEGWVEGMQVNSIEPNPETETSRDGKVVLTYGPLERGDLLRIWMQFEVNPTNTGRRAYGLELDDETRPLARISRTMRVMP